MKFQSGYMLIPRYHIVLIGLVVFLAFINDLPHCVKLRIRPLADDCIMHAPIKLEEDCTSLQ